MKTFSKALFKCSQHQNCERVVNIQCQTKITAAMSHQFEKHSDCCETLRHNVDKHTAY